MLGLVSVRLRLRNKTCHVPRVDYRARRVSELEKLRQCFAVELLEWPRIRA